MTTDEKWEFIEKTLEVLDKNMQRRLEITRLILLEPESPLHDDVSQDLLIKALGMLLDDVFENIEWFVYENEFGRRELGAGREEDMRPIKNVKDLRWLLEL